jgi:predicted DNA-binding transcriptional regulator AlpA
MDSLSRARLMDAAVRARGRLSLADAESLVRDAVGTRGDDLTKPEFVTREVMDEFRKLNEADVVWSAGAQAWRLRRADDPPGRAASLEEVPEVVFDIVEPPLLLNPKDAAAYLGFSRSVFYRYDSMGVIPIGVYIGGRRYWRRDELRAWVRAGCPPRHKWEVLQDSKRPGRR